MADIAIAGMEALRARVNGIPGRLVKGALKAGLRQASNMIRDQARANFNAGAGPSDLSGALKASIRVTPRRGTPTKVVFNIVAGVLTNSQIKRFGADSAFYALFVEKGHINRALGQALRGSKESVKAARKASNSNTPARPFMRPALDSKASAALALMVEVIGSKLPEDVK